MHPMAAKELLRNANNFPPKILAKNIEVLHEYDLKSKGVGSSSASSGDLLNEMLFQLLN
jgi:DNA polymerase-3 subunit delta